MNNLGKEKLAFKLASVVTEIFHKQEEMISLYWKNVYEVSVSGSSNKDISSYKKTLRQPHRQQLAWRL
jgi:hypothetical protein